MKYTIITSIYDPNISKKAKTWIRDNVSECMISFDGAIAQYNVEDIIKRWDDVEGFPEADMEEILTIRDFHILYIEI